MTLGETNHEKGQRQNEDRIRTSSRRWSVTDDGLPIAASGYTVADAVNAWLSYGLRGRDSDTIGNYACLARNSYPGEHSSKSCCVNFPPKTWIDGCRRHQGTSALVRSACCIRYSARSIRHAQARDKVKRNVALLCDVPTGRPGRPSKALTLDQATAIIKAARRFAAVRLHSPFSPDRARAQRNCAHSAGAMWTWRAVRNAVNRQYHHPSQYGARYVPGETRRRRSHVERLQCPTAVWQRFLHSGITGRVPGLGQLECECLVFLSRAGGARP